MKKTILAMALLAVAAMATNASADPQRRARSQQQQQPQQQQQSEQQQPSQGSDSRKVEDIPGNTRKVKGRDDVEGEISGTPAAGSAFTRLEIGMKQRQVEDILGSRRPDCGSYITGKAWIPWHFGGDKYRTECAYKGLGRLVFASQSDFDSTAYLIHIIHDAREDGYR